MSTNLISNVRAASCLVLTLVLVAAVPTGAAIHLSDVSPATGVGGQLLGYSAAFIPDLDGDGRDELLVGVPGDQRAGANAGAVFLWLGGRDVTEAPNRIWEGVPDDGLGFCVAHVGDLDDDGTADFALGAPWYSQAGTRRGRVLVFYGSANPPASGDAASRADDILVGAVGGDQFGFSLAAAGDFNGDGRDDLIVGAPWSNARGTSSGAAYVVYGASAGVSTDLADATTMAGQAAGYTFGWSVAGAGNFLGGNADAIAVGAPRFSWAGENAGAVFVFEGDLGAEPDTLVEMVLLADVTNRYRAYYGWQVRGRGRWNGDGFDDLAVGAPGANDGSGIRGRVEIHYGDLSPDAVAERYLEGVAANDSLGHCLDWVREPGGGSTDLVVGAPFANAQDDAGNGTSDGGRAYRWPAGSGSGLASGVQQLPVTPMVPGLAGGDHYGGWVAANGDFDGDGVADLAVGAPTGNIGNNAVAGYIHLMDSSLETVPTLLAGWTAAWRADGAALLRFALGGTSAIVTVDLIRRDDRGAELLWSGPPRSGAPATGVLTVDRAEFVYVDTAAGRGATYDLRLRFGDGTTGTVASLAGPSAAAPVAAGLELGVPWPNPANPLVSVRFRAPAGRDTRCCVYDARGRLVRTLDLPPADGNWQRVDWDGLTSAGTGAASGMYLLRLTSGGETRARPVTLVR